MPKHISRELPEISAEDAHDAQQRALEIEEEKRLAKKERLKRKRSKRPSNQTPSLKERLVAPLLLLLFLLCSWLVWWLA